MYFQRNCRAPRNRSISVSPARNNKRANYQPSSQEYPLTIDTGATQSIIRPDVVRAKCEAISNIRLRTATGETATIYGETKAKVTITNISVSYLFIVDDIASKVIIGVDFMIDHAINLNMGQQIMSWRNVEIPFDVGYKHPTTISKWIIDMGAYGQNHRTENSPHNLSDFEKIICKNSGVGQCTPVEVINNSRHNLPKYQQMIKKNFAKMWRMDNRFSRERNKVKKLYACA